MSSSLASKLLWFAILRTACTNLYHGWCKNASIDVAGENKARSNLMEAVLSAGNNNWLRIIKVMDGHTPILPQAPYHHIDGICAYVLD